MIAPRVIGTNCIDTRARRLEGASEVGHRKCRHLVLHTKLDCRREERIDRLRSPASANFPVRLSLAE